MYFVKDPHYQVNFQENFYFILIEFGHTVRSGRPQSWSLRVRFYSFFRWEG